MNWAEHTRAVYQLALTSEALVAPGAAPVTIKLNGELTLSAAGAAASVNLLANMHNVIVQGGNGHDTANAAQLTQELQEPWGFELNQGRLERLHQRGSASRFAVSIATTVAAAFQYRAERSPSTTWVAEETDASGRYNVLYALAASPGDLTKSKQNYLDVELPSAMPLANPVDLTPKIMASNGALHVEQGRLTHVRLHEELQIALTSTAPLKSKTDIELTQTQFGLDAKNDGWPQLLASTVSVTPGRALATDRREPQLDETRIGNYTFDSALTELQKENAVKQPFAAQKPDASDEQKLREQSRVFTAMTAILRSHPADIARAVAVIQRGSPASKSLLDALGSSRTPETQQALAQLAQNVKLAKDLRRQAAFALIRTPHPTPDSVQVLIKNIKDETLRPYAVYGLGTYARRLREVGEVPLSNQASEALLTQLSGSKESDRVDVLRGIANSGYAPALDRVRPLFLDPDPSIRAAAVGAIRLMPNPEVESLIAARLGADEKQSVRLAALDAAGLREPGDTLVTAVSDVAMNAPDSQSRARAVRLIEGWLPKRPELRKSLEQVAWSDSREGVRKLAQAGLAPEK